MSRRLLNVMTAISLLLCAAVAALGCAGSSGTIAWVQWTTPFGATYFAGSLGGSVYFSRQAVSFPRSSPELHANTSSYGTVLLD